MKRVFAVVAIAAALIVASIFLWTLNDEAPASAGGYKDAEYLIEGQPVKLEDGVAEREASPGSVSTIVTRYFGNELNIDLDGDGREDVAFVLAQTRGGSGTFYYAVAALATDQGYVGSDGYLLGDRIEPQATMLSPNPRHDRVVVFNYADRAPTEAMTTLPSIGKSVYLKIDASDMRWGIVEPDFEGESR